MCFWQLSILLEYCGHSCSIWLLWCKDCYDNSAHTGNTIYQLNMDDYYNDRLFTVIVPKQLANYTDASVEMLLAMMMPSTYPMSPSMTTRANGARTDGPNC